MIDLLFSIMMVCLCDLSGLSIASSYEHGSSLIVVEASALCISLEMFTYALHLVTLSVNNGAFFDLLEVAMKDCCNNHCVISSSLNGA